jgi:hypothetical protein
MDEGKTPDEAWTQARKEVEDEARGKYSNSLSLVFRNLQADAAKYRPKGAVAHVDSPLLPEPVWDDRPGHGFGDQRGKIYPGREKGFGNLYRQTDGKDDPGPPAHIAEAMRKEKEAQQKPRRKPLEPVQ